MRLFEKIKIYVITIAATAAVLAPGCSKVDTDMYVDVAPYLSLPDVDTLIPYIYVRDTILANADGTGGRDWVEVFYHFADTATWMVDSYQDALQGIITNKRNGETRNPEGRGIQTQRWISTGPYTGGPVMLVAVDREEHGFYKSEMYGWREVEVQAGLARITVPVTFSPAKRGDTLPRYRDEAWQTIREFHRPTNSKWYIVNDNPYIGGDEGDEGDDGDDEGDDEGGEDEGDGEGGEGGDQPGDGGR